MKFRLVKPDPGKELFNDIVSNVRECGYKYVFKYHGGVNEDGIVVVLSLGVIEVVHVHGLLFITIHSRSRDVKDMLDFFSDAVKYEGFEAEVIDNE
jgi:hypothetical protein